MAGQGYVPKYEAKGNAGTYTEKFELGRAEGPRRGSNDGSANPAPARRNSHGHGPRRPARTNPKPAAATASDLYGDSHIPAFGDWNNPDGDANYTGIFDKAGKARKGQVEGPALQPSAASRPTSGSGSGDLYKPHHFKKRRSSWCCFGA